MRGLTKRTAAPRRMSRACLQKLKEEGVRGIVLDLRRNGGGSLEEAIHLTGLFIRHGPVVQTRGPAGDIEIGATIDPSELYTGPLVVLTSRFSASASEILAGALQDYGRALIVGDSSTFGKGTVQSILPLAPILKQYGGLGRKCRRVEGDDPQILSAERRINPAPRSQSRHRDTFDQRPQRNRRISDERPAAMGHGAERALSQRKTACKPLLEALRAKSAQRVATERGFAWIRDEIALRDKNRATKSVSLNEVERRTEKEASQGAAESARAGTGGTRRTGPAHLRNHSQKHGHSWSACATHPPPPKAKAAETADEDAPSLSDREVIMNEAQRILADYVGMERDRSLVLRSR